MQEQGKPSRRTKTRWPGVYYREAPNGRRYEISFADSTGRRRWRTVEGGEKDARAALEEVRGRKRKGERIAPSRATLAEVAEVWLREQTSNLRPRTVERYEGALRLHVVPRLGRVRVAELDEDDIATLIADLRDGREPDGEKVKSLSGWSIRVVLGPLGRVLGYAARRGIIGSNPMQRLERGERPAVGRREQRVLSEEEIRRLLDAADPTYRAFLATAVFSGLRLAELLGLTWAEIDFDAGELRVRYRSTVTAAGCRPRHRRRSGPSSCSRRSEGCCASTRPRRRSRSPVIRCSRRGRARRSTTATSSGAASTLPPTVPV